MARFFQRRPPKEGENYTHCIHAETIFIVRRAREHHHILLAMQRDSGMHSICNEICRTPCFSEKLALDAGGMGACARGNAFFVLPSYFASFFSEIDFGTEFVYIYYLR